MPKTKTTEFKKDDWVVVNDGVLLIGGAVGTDVNLGVEIGRYSRGLQLRHGELEPEEYAAILLEWLVPHRDALAALLRQVANERTAAA